MRGVSQPPRDPYQQRPGGYPRQPGHGQRQGDAQQRGYPREPGYPDSPYRDDRRSAYPDGAYPAGQHPYPTADQHSAYQDERYGDQRSSYQDERYGDHRSGYQAERYGDQRSAYPDHREQRASQPSRPPQQPRQPQPSRSRGRRVLGLGLTLAILGALVLLVSVTLLPWVDGGVSLAGLWDRVTGVQDMGFGDWYVLVAGYPLVALGILLSFAAVLESVAMKVIWVALTVLGLGYVAFRYGIGPLTGLFGEESGFSLVEIGVAAAALAGIVVVLFVLKSAVGMFRRIAGLVLLGLSGVHISAVVDLVSANGFGELSAGAYGPALGYLLAGAAAFVGPGSLVPGR
ncbi:hypothetical protein Actkin_01278 [Actinokineospora sp. UTMC 2448]|nr:hypothetical protein Actkin_01278 [Actinokineospora sp. UTMC 2448]